MKKRIVCVLLTLIMLVSLVPVTALTASAASLKTSEAAITIMKKLAIFKKDCYQVSGTNEFRIGYGTVCSEEHKTEYEGGTVKDSSDAGKHHVTQAQADQALRKVVLSLDEQVNSFASSNGLTLSQCQHDALVLFTFDEGNAWMSGSGVVRSAIISNASTNDLLKAMSDWAGGSGDFRRRMIVVNMYKNGIYSDVTPSSFGTVTYNPNCGTIPQNGTGIYKVLFDTSKTSAHIPSPTRSGFKFIGWYTAREGGERVPSLTASCNGKELWAAWQDTSVTPDNVDKASYVHEISETLKVSQLASRNIYLSPKTSKTTAGTIDKKATTVSVDRDFFDDNGNRWCRLSGQSHRWVQLKASAQDNSNNEYTGGKIDVTVTVTNSYVNRRASDSASSAKTGVYTAGTKLKIVATNEAKTWGQVEENGVTVGWIALMYTDWSTVYDGSSPSDSNNTTPIATATVTYNGYLNARSDPGVDNKIVGGFAKDTTVNIFEIRTVNGHRWGRTSTGWICLTYTRVKMLTDKSVSDQGVMDYAFEVTMANSGADIKTYAEPSTNSVESDTIKAGTTGLKITNAAVADGLIWVKAHWTVKETDKKGKTNIVAKSGWVTYNNFNLVPTKFTVVSDTLNIREDAGSQNKSKFKLTKGVEVEVHEIKLTGEEIWGKIVGYTPKDDSGIENYDGWINLASNYVKRSSKITIEGGTKGAIGTGTVVNADSVRVRMTGALYGQVLGSINRGTKVAVLEEKDGWYKIDFDVDNNSKTDSWVYGQYLEVKMGTVESGTESSGTSGSTGTTQKTDGTGKGIVANTYSGVNVRSGAGIGNAVVGKILNGTEVTILEVKVVGTAKWGRVKQGWICMDYVTMISYDDIPGNNSNNGSNGNKGTGVDSFDEVERTTTTAVYTGTAKDGIKVYKEPNPNLGSENIVRTISGTENVTIHELTAVTLEIYQGRTGPVSGGKGMGEIEESNREDDRDDSETEEKKPEEKKPDNTGEKDIDEDTVVKQTSYWARINDGWIQDPQTNITLNALDEKIHTVTGASKLNVRSDAGTDYDSIAELKKGDQVPVTKLEIVKNSANRTLTVWGRVETSDGIVGYCDLSYMSEGALYEKDKNTTPSTPTTAPAPTIGSTGNTGDGGFVSNGSGYKYTGKVINTTSLNVRVTPSTGAKKATTLKGGASLVIYETKISEDMAWGRCDAGWVYLYYVDLTPASGSSAIDARVVYNDNTVIYTDNAASSVAGTYSRMSVIDIYEYVGDMARTDLGWVSTGNLL